MNWRGFISGIYASRKNEPGLMETPLFQPAASIQQIAELEFQLSTTVPTHLRSLLLETNGIMSMLKIGDADWLENMWLLWPIFKINEQNLYFRGERATSDFERRFDDLFFFADAGSDGIVFAHPVENGIAAPNVLAWFPIENELISITTDLMEFVEGWLLGSISV